MRCCLKPQKHLLILSDVLIRAGRQKQSSDHHTLVPFRVVNRWALSTSYQTVALDESVPGAINFLQFKIVTILYGVRRAVINC